MTKLVAIVGSLRKDSINRKTLNALLSLASDTVRLSEAAIGEVPLYNADLEEPDSVQHLKKQIEEADGLILITPEYNYGIPGVLKNAIDWVSRPSYQSVLANKPVAILGASPGLIGTARAQGQLKQVLLGMISDVFPYPEICIGSFGAKVNAAGELSDETTRQHLEKFLGAFSEWAKARS